MSRVSSIWDAELDINGTFFQLLRICYEESETACLVPQIFINLWPIFFFFFINSHGSLLLLSLSSRWVILAMDRTQILLVGLPIFLFFSDIINLFAPPPSPKPTHHHHHHHHPIPQPQPEPHLQQPLEFPTQVFFFTSLN